jgi:hypothetical protein
MDSLLVPDDLGGSYGYVERVVDGSGDASLLLEGDGA